MAYKKYDAYHLGMQPEEVKEALEGGGASAKDNPTVLSWDDPIYSFTMEDINTLLNMGGQVTKDVAEADFVPPDDLSKLPLILNIGSAIGTTFCVHLATITSGPTWNNQVIFNEAYYYIEVAAGYNAETHTYTFTNHIIKISDL